MSDKDLKLALVRILLQHQGRTKAIRGSELAQMMGFKNDRAVRLAIRDLIADGYPIASTTQEPAGYFIAASLEEANEYMDDLKGRLIQDALRRRDFKLSMGWLTDRVVQGKLI